MAVYSTSKHYQCTDQHFHEYAFIIYAVSSTFFLQLLLIKQMVPAGLILTWPNFHMKSKSDCMLGLFLILSLPDGTNTNKSKLTLITPNKQK